VAKREITKESGKESRKCERGSIEHLVNGGDAKVGVQSGGELKCFAASIGGRQSLLQNIISHLHLAANTTTHKMVQIQHF
jgi:hypothetical protein